MWLGFLLIVIAGVLWGAIGVLNSKVSRRGLDYAAYAAIGVVIGAVLMWGVWVRPSVLLQRPPYALPIALICWAAGIVAGFGYVALQRAMKSGHHGAVWTVAQSAMALPLLTAILGFNESLTAAGVIGMGLLFLSLLMMGLGKHEKDESATPDRWFWFALLAFLMFGLSQSINSIPSLKHWPDPANLRTGCYTIGQCTFYVTLMWLRGSRIRWPETLLAARYAIYGNVSMVLMYRSMDLLSAHKTAGMTLPVGVGTCIVVFALYSVLWLREKASFFVIGGILVAIAGVGCLTLRGLGW